MKTVTIQTAKTTLSQLVARVEAGEEIILVRGKPLVAKLVLFHAHERRRRFGAMRRIVTVDPEFFEPVPEDELAAWGR